MSRRKFIESHGATCSNWQWSWSFVNHKDKIIIFGAWDQNTEGSTTLIFSKDWKTNAKGNKRSAYPQSREHVRLIEEDGYTLMTFPMIHSDARKDEDGIGPAKIEGFVEELKTKYLKRVGDNWYASDNSLGNSIPEEIEDPEEYTEGTSKTVSVNVYERDSRARKKCIEHHGYKCAVCTFSFEDTYGSIGENFIHVHHIIPLSEVKKEYKPDPIKDLIPVCANCHAIIHKTRPALTIEQLKEHLHQKREP